MVWCEVGLGFGWFGNENHVLWERRVSRLVIFRVSDEMIRQWFRDWKYPLWYVGGQFVMWNLIEWDISNIKHMFFGS